MTDVPTGLDYGERQQQEQLAGQQAPPIPVSTNPITQPTQRPTEPISAGLPVGAGPGPEANVSPKPEQSITDRQLIELLPALELIAAGRTHVSQATLQVMRRLRANLPVDAYDG